MAGCAVAVAMGEMTFDKVARAPWFALVTPFAFGPPTFDAVLIGTMTLVMIVVMIESTGMFLALADITGKPLTREALTAGLRVDGLGTLIGGVFNTFPYTSFSQNVGLVGVTGVKSRWVCVAGGAIMVVLGLLPKLAALVESVPLFVLGGAGLVMFGMVVASGIRILSAVDFTGNRHNLYIVAIAVGVGMIPQEAPRWTQQMAHALRPLLESGILLTSLAAVLLNLYFNGGRPAADTHQAWGGPRARDARIRPRGKPPPPGSPGEASQRAREYLCATGDVLWRGEFIRPVAHAGAAGDEQHGGRRHARHEQRVVIRATDHPFVREPVGFAAGHQRVDDHRVTAGWWIGVDDLRVDGHAASSRHVAACGHDPIQHGVAPDLIDVARVDLELAPAGHAVDRARKHMAQAGRGHGVDRPRGPGRGFHRQGDLRSGRERRRVAPASGPRRHGRPRRRW